MKKLIRTITVLSICTSVFFYSYLLTVRYLNRFRRHYITLENEYVNV